jgi:leucine-zipper of insertion element IS481
MNPGNKGRTESNQAKPSNGRLRIVRPCTARGRFAVILPMFHFKAREATGQGSWLLLPQGVEVLTLTALVEHLSRQFRVSKKTIWRWYGRFLESGHHGLIDKPRRDRFVFRAFKARPAAIALVASKDAQGCSVTRIHTELKQLWPRICRGSSRCPSRGTVANLIAMMAPASSRKKANKRTPVQLTIVGAKNV